MSGASIRIALALWSLLALAFVSGCTYAHAPSKITTRVTPTSDPLAFRPHALP